MNAQISHDLSKITILTQVLNFAVLSNDKDKILQAYNAVLAQLSAVGNELAVRYGFEARRV